MCVIRVAKYIPLKYFQNISPQYFSRQVPPQLSRAPARDDLFERQLRLFEIIQIFEKSELFIFIYLSDIWDYEYLK